MCTYTYKCASSCVCVCVCMHNHVLTCMHCNYSFIGAFIMPKLLVCEAFSYWCMRPQATSVCGLKLLVYAASSY
jgi:hypothetical protein